MDVLAEDGAFEKRRKHVRQQQIRNGFELITSRRMPGNLNSQRAQLLHQPPDLGAAGADLVGNLGAADDDGGVVHQQPHNSSEAQIRLLRRKVRVVAGAPARERFLESRPVAALLMRGIMREKTRKNKSGCEMEDGRPARQTRSAGPTGEDAVLTSYTGVTRRLISTATAECVSAPTEIKSTPVSA